MVSSPEAPQSSNDNNNDDQQPRRRLKPNFWPFVPRVKKAPPLHRALQKNDDDDDDDEEEAAFLIQELATKRRIRRKDALARNALHIACMNQPDLDTVILLIDVYPKAVDQQDKVGRLPLHTACANRASLDVVEYLWRQNPETVLEVTDRGTTPLYCAIENKAPLEVIEFLVSKDPDAVKATQYKLGKTPVHAAVSRGQSIDVIRFLMRKRPQAVEEVDAWGKTPLACACASSAHYDDPDQLAAVLDMLVDFIRIKQPDRAGMLPLHIACMNSARLADIEMLLDEYPEAIRTPDKQGRLPLHAACANPRVELEVLQFLVEAYPDALKTFDKMGAVPLHLSIQRKLPIDCVYYLIDQAEGAVRTREASTHMYPLHLACKAGADYELLDTLMDIYPKAIDAIDNNGNTLFHVACTSRKLDLELADRLLEQCHYETVQIANEDGALPLHLAVSNRASWPVLQLLIDHYPEALDIKDDKGNVPLHRAFMTTTKMHVLVRLAQAHPRAHHRINKRGKIPLDLASLELEKRFKRASRWYNLRMAFCPCCIRMKFAEYEQQYQPGTDTAAFEQEEGTDAVAFEQQEEERTTTVEGTGTISTRTTPYENVVV